ncbi:MAG: PfkB family carbohydrate kinase [bacterium]
MLLGSKKKLDVVTIGGATRDMMFYSGEGELINTSDITKQKLLAFEYGAKIMVDKLNYSFGGGAANVAVSFAGLGLKVAPVCRVAQDEIGQAILQNFKNRSVDYSLLSIDLKEHSGFSVVLTVKNAAHEHILFTYRGANDLLSVDDLRLSKVDVKWFYVSSLPEVGWEKVMHKVVEQKKPIAWNPGSHQLKNIEQVKAFLPNISLFVVNHDEALFFKKLKDIKGLLKTIQDFGPKIVVITDGSKGAYAYDGKKYYYIKAQAVKAVDTVGVGDAFASAFTAALIYGKNIKQALRWGMKNSASCITQIGAQNGLLTLKRIEK